MPKKKSQGHTESTPWSLNDASDYLPTMTSVFDGHRVTMPECLARALVQLDRVVQASLQIDPTSDGQRNLHKAAQIALDTVRALHTAMCIINPQPKPAPLPKAIEAEQITSERIASVLLAGSTQPPQTSKDKPVT